MLNKDSVLLEKAYMSVSKPVPSVSPEETEENLNVVETTPVSELAPSVEPSPAVVGTDPTLNVTNVVAEPEEHSCGCEEVESEEQDMVVDNLNSIRESIMKTAAHCANGGHLEPWQQQKLAIAMDNLASIARSLSSGAHC